MQKFFIIFMVSFLVAGCTTAKKSAKKPVTQLLSQENENLIDAELFDDITKPKKVVFAGFAMPETELNIPSARISGLVRQALKNHNNVQLISRETEQAMLKELKIAEMQNTKITFSGPAQAQYIAMGRIDNITLDANYIAPQISNTGKSLAILGTALTIASSNKNETDGEHSQATADLVKTGTEMKTPPQCKYRVEVSGVLEMYKVGDNTPVKSTSFLSRGVKTYEVSQNTTDCNAPRLASAALKIYATDGVKKSIYDLISIWNRPEADNNQTANPE